MPKQTGPKTPEGKVNSSQNALKHGLYTDRMFVLSNETPENWEKMLEEWTRKLQPRDEPERLMVVDIAHAQWKLRRSRYIESGIFDGKMKDQIAQTVACSPEGADEVLRLASAFTSLADNSAALRELHRYESRARKAFNSGMNALEQLRRIAPQPAQPAEQPQKASTPVLAPLPPPPALPPHFRPEWQRLARRIPHFDPVRNARHMSGPLRKWCESRAA